MKQLLLLTLFIPTLLWAQEDSKYLAGAVPVENGKVVFAKEINAPSFSKDEVYDKMLDWADGFFSEDGNRVVYSDKAKGDIAAVGQTKHRPFSGPYGNELSRHDGMREPEMYSESGRYPLRI